MVIKKFERKENLERKTIENINTNEPLPNRGGIVFERSRCCNAPINYTSGGVALAYCSKCKKRYEEFRVG